jgi:hypothetical protein
MTLAAIFFTVGHYCGRIDSPLSAAACLFIASIICASGATSVISYLSKKNKTEQAVQCRAVQCRWVASQIEDRKVGNKRG